MNSKILYLLPYGGLCNRINTISSAVHFAIENDFRLKIFWENNIDLAADFSDLFEEFNHKDVELIKLRWYHLKYFRARPTNLFLTRVWRFIGRINQIEDWSSKKGNLKVVINSRKNYLSTCHSIGDKYDINDIFKPNVAITNILNKLKEEFAINTVGVHIRRGDHARAIDASPLENFYLMMDQEVSNDENTKFYLATDSNTVKESLEERYKGKIITNDLPLTRKNITGMTGAVIDLWTLSNTNKMIGTKFSMFSLVASEIQGIKLDL